MAPGDAGFQLAVELPTREPAESAPKKRDGGLCSFSLS
jgi:hypothetical protein